MAAPSMFVDQRDEARVDQVLDSLEGPLNAWFRPVVRGFDRIPKGSALMVANHNGGVMMPDVWMFGCAMRKAHGTSSIPYALVHDAALDIPILGPGLASIGGVRASQASADALFSAGKKVLVFPGGDVENLRPFRNRDKIEFGPRRGYVRLAIRHGVPVSPIVTSGAHSGMVVLDDGQKIARALGITKLRIHVCPTVLTIPWGVTFGFPPPYLPLPIQTYIEALEPITFSRSGEEAAADEAYVQACHEEVVRRMQFALERLSRERRATRRRELHQALDWVIDRADAWLTPKPTANETTGPALIDEKPLSALEEAAPRQVLRALRDASRRRSTPRAA